MANKHRPRRKVTDQIRGLIESCGMTRYRISKLTGIHESGLMRFMSGERGLSAKALDRLGELLDLKVTAGKAAHRRQRQTKRPKSNRDPITAQPRFKVESYEGSAPDAVGDE